MNTYDYRVLFYLDCIWTYIILLSFIYIFWHVNYNTLKVILQTSE